MSASATGASDRFRKITKTTEDTKPYFKDPKFYQNVLTGEGEVAKRMHNTLALFMKAENPEDRSLYRNRLIPLYWELVKTVVANAAGALSDPKMLLLRFGVLLPTMLDKDQREMVAVIVAQNATDQPIYYMDEWLLHVAAGAIGASATDETGRRGPQKSSSITQQLEAARGREAGHKTRVQGQDQELRTLEEEVQSLVSRLVQRDTHPTMPEVKAPPGEHQLNLISDITNNLKSISTVAREMTKTIEQWEDLHASVQRLQQQAAAAGDKVEQVNPKAAAKEAETVQQMAKMCVGRQGNPFPLLYTKYFRSGLHSVGTRENVNNILAEVEAIDPGVFERTFRQQTTRIVPNIVLIPSYGDQGICWEPFERLNRASSRGRLAIPMFGKDLRTAILSALGDLRWQTARERASHYWMEEGLTGWYYQWFNGRRMRGDVKDRFVRDYVLWITKESEGTQKLEREVRDIFWRYVPFPQSLKEELKNRGFVYQELYKKDQNRARSDGY